MMSYSFARSDFERGDICGARYWANCLLKERVDAAKDYPVSTVLEKLRQQLADDIRTYRIQ